MQITASSVLYHQTSTATHEGLLFHLLSIIFPHDKIQRKAQKDVNVKYPRSSKYLEFDIWIPKYSLGFEFQDSYHYATTWYYQHSLEHINDKDNIKRNLAIKNELTLITVPCWWTGTIESLKSAIHFQRPDVILSSDHYPIHLNPPNDYFASSLIPGVGELMLASFPYNSNLVESDWWIGEKYDGIRCCWNPSQHNLYTRFGKIVHLFSNFNNLLPQIFLDGELWLGRGQFSILQSLITDISIQCALKMISFDVPSVACSDMDYEDRYTLLQSSIPSEHPFNIIAPRTTSNRINWFMQEIITANGEGVILQKKHSFYESGRSQQLYKLKGVQNEQEGIVIQIDWTHSVILKLVGGDIVTIPIQNVKVVPSIGDIVTLSYEISKRQDKSFDPIISKIRHDLLWDDVLQSFYQPSPPPVHGEVKSESVVNPEYFKVENRRLFFENFASGHGFDFHNPENWYIQSKKDILATKGAYRVISYHKNNIAQALIDLFPNIGLVKSNLPFQPLNVWETKSLRKKFFLNYAKVNKFDPNIPTNWYIQSESKILEIKGAKQILSYYSNSLAKALVALLPDVGIDKSKFKLKRSNTKLTNSHLNFFLNYSKAYSFDPLVAENWYLQPKNRIMAFKGAHSVMYNYNNNIATALSKVFPKLILDPTFFNSKEYWKNEIHQKRLLENFARQNNFDPLLPSNWRSQRNKLIKLEGIHKILPYYNNDLPTMLAKVFPDLGLITKEFYGNEWSEENNRIQFFHQYANKNNFDPLIPENWYSQPTYKLLSTKGMSGILNYYDNNIAEALVQLFPNIGFDKQTLKDKMFQRIVVFSLLLFRKEKETDQIVPKPTKHRN